MTADSEGGAAHGPRRVARRGAARRRRLLVTRVTYEAWRLEAKGPLSEVMAMNNPMETLFWLATVTVALT